jgi:chromosome segregation ATPase
VDAAPSIAGWDVVKEALARLREDNQHFEQFCAEQLDELDSQREELARQQEEFEAQRAELVDELEKARAQLSRLASVAVELADARSEIVKLKGELRDERDAAAEAQRRTAGMEKQVSQLRREIAALETDLAESRDRVDSEKRRMNDQRAEWVGDLLRSALDMQSQPHDADLKVVHDEPDTGAESESESEAIACVDPVLGAVMQQFEALQKGRKPARQVG